MVEAVKEASGIGLKVKSFGVDDAVTCGEGVNCCVCDRLTMRGDGVNGNGCGGGRAPNGAYCCGVGVVVVEWGGVRGHFANGPGPIGCNRSRFERFLKSDRSIGFQSTRAQKIGEN